MPESIRREIHDLRALYWSERDPEGRAFAPLADALRRAGELDPAVELLADGLGRLPDFVTGHVVAGWVHRARGSFSEAEQAFQRVLELDHDNVSALRGMGLLLADTGRTAEALSYFLRLDREDPGDPEVEARLIELGEAGPRVVEIADLAPDDLVVVPIESLAPDEGEPWTIEELAPQVTSTAETSQVEATAPTAVPSIADAGRDDGGVHTTRTMAELYASQGLVQRAIAMYEQLAEQEPGDPALLARRDELIASSESGEGVAPAIRGSDEFGEEMDELAQHMASPSDANDDLDSPFAWTREPDEEADDEQATSDPSTP